MKKDILFSLIELDKGNTDYDIFIEEDWENLTPILYTKLMKLIPSEEKHIYLTGGLMTHLSIRGGQGAKEWSDYISDYVHEQHPGKDDWSFKFVLNDEELVKSPYAKNR